MSKRLSAFTLVEIIIAMGIGAMILAAGIGGFQTFRQTIQFQQGYLAVVSQLQTTQNMARNSVASRVVQSQRATDPIGAQVDGYALFFNPTNYNLNYCLYPTPNQTGPIDCSTIEVSNLKLAEYADVTVTASTGTCYGIFFARMTGNISAMNGLNATPNDTAADCLIQVRHSQNAALVRVIGINVRANNIYEI